MSKDMKLIMESWRSNVINEKIDQCGEATIGQVMAVYDAIQKEKDAEAAKEKLQDRSANLAAWGMSLLGLAGELKLGGLIGGKLGGVLAGTAAGPAGATAAIVGGVIIGAIRAKRGKKGTKQKMDGILKTLCIDPKLIEILDDDVEDAFLNDRAFKALLAYIAEQAKVDPSAKIPNFNAELTTFVHNRYLKRNKPRKQTDIQDIS